jgi:hypothetical protein
MTKGQWVHQVLSNTLMIVPGETGSIFEQAVAFKPDSESEDIVVSILNTDTQGDFVAINVDSEGIPMVRC